MSKNLEIDELILCILYYTKNRYSLKTRLIKLLFVFDKIFPINDEIQLNLNFFPYNYGPVIDFNEYDLILIPLKNAGIIEVENIEEGNFHKELISLTKSRLDSIEEIIIKKIINQKPKEKMELIKEICIIFDNGDLNQLIQFVYFLEQKYTKKSIIKEKIFNAPRNILQTKIIILISKIRVRYLVKFIEYANSILKIFNFDTSTNEFPFLDIFLIIKKGLEANSLDNESIRNFVSILDHSCLNNRKFLKLKKSLLNLLLLEDIEEFNNEILISILIFILNSLQLHWPLDSEERKVFLNLNSEFFKEPLSFYTPEFQFDVLQKEIYSIEEFDRFQNLLPDEKIEEEEEELIYSQEL